MALLQIIQRTARLLSIPVPTEVVNSTDVQVQQLYEIANEEGEELLGAHDWQILRAQYTFPTVDDPDQVNPLPSDFDRFVHDTFFNRTTMRQVIGPITPQQWQSIQAQPQLNRVFLAFIQRGGEFLITPTPTAGETIAYEYISKNWAVSDADVPQDMFLADTDETFLPERLFRLGIRWRFLKSKGLEYAEDFRTYQTELNQTKARDGGNGSLSSTGRDGYILSPNLPIGNFPGP